MAYSGTALETGLMFKHRAGKEDMAPNEDLLVTLKEARELSGGEFYLR